MTKIDRKEDIQSYKIEEEKTPSIFSRARPRFILKAYIFFP